MDPSVWLAFFVASLALLLVPGPTVLLVLAYALGQGRRIAVPTALGVATGDLIAMTASLLGFGAVVLASATLFTTLKWIGAIYLVWMGVKMILGAKGVSLDVHAAEGSIRPATAYANAAAVTALNPKAIIFFIAFVPQFIDPARPLLLQSVILVSTFVGLAAANALVYALLADRMRTAIRRPSVLAWFTRAGGGALVAMGIATASVRRAS